MPPSAALNTGLNRFGLAATLLCPIFLVHGRGFAEAAIDAVAATFLLHATLSGEWRWLRQGWVTAAGIWWLWLVFCSLPDIGQGGPGSLFQALATLRFLLFAAALQSWTLRRREHRLAMAWLLAGCFAYIAAQMLLQAAIGTNLFGDPRFHDGTLTGPYDKPRAAAPLSRLLFPTLLPAAAWVMQRKPGVAGLGGANAVAGHTRANATVGHTRANATVGHTRANATVGHTRANAIVGHTGATAVAGIAGAIAILLAGLALMVLAGQRMPLLLSLLGLLVAGLMLRRLRTPLLACLVAAPALVAASAFATPRSFGHLVILFERQMSHFGSSPYGLIYARALVLARAHKLTGLGFDGFRNGCPDPSSFHGLPPLSPVASDGGGAAICVQHAHNHYLQALTDAGVPGLVLFCAMVLCWLVALAPRGSSSSLGKAGPLGNPGSLDRAGALDRAWRTGLFVAVLIQEWPIASTSAFTNLPLGGWFFLLLGLGLAAAPPYMQPSKERPA